MNREKILIATDLHGSGFYTEELLKIIEKEQPTKTVLLGDIYNHGPRNPLTDKYNPTFVAEQLAKIEHLVVVRGNCDSEVDQMISESFTFLSHHIIYEFGRKLFFTHGHIYNKANLPSDLKSGDIIFYGHFHINDIEIINGVTAVNVGSLSLPKDNNHSYCVVDSVGVKLKNINGTEIASCKF